MKWKELTRTFMITSNWKKPGCQFVWGSQRYIKEQLLSTWGSDMYCTAYLGWHCQSVSGSQGYIKDQLLSRLHGDPTCTVQLTLGDTVSLHTGVGITWIHKGSATEYMRIWHVLYILPWVTLSVCVRIKGIHKGSVTEYIRIRHVLYSLPWVTLPVCVRIIGIHKRSVTE